MKTAGFQRYKYSGDVYKFVDETEGSSSSKKYYFAGKISLTIGVDKTQKMVIRCEQPFALGTLISNIKDINNNSILDDTIWQISNLQPILNAFGSVESYRMSAVKFQGVI